MCSPKCRNCPTGIQPRTPCRHRMQGERGSGQRTQLHPPQPLATIPRGSLRQGSKSLRIQKPSMPPDERPFPFGYGQNPKPNEKSKLAAVLFSLEGVLDAADGVLNLTLNLVSVAFRHQLGVADRLAVHLLHCALYLLGRSDDPVLVHRCILRCSLPERERFKLWLERLVVVD